MIAAKNKRPRHFPLTQPDVQFLFGLNASLTAAEWRIWLYLVTLDPFGDVGAKYDAEELMNFCNIQKSTYFAAKAKFIKLGLFEFVEGSPKVRNLSGSKANHRSEVSEPSSKVSERRSEIVDFNSEVSARNSEISELQTLGTMSAWDSGTPHTLSDIIQTLSDTFTKPTLHPQREEIENLDLEIQNLDQEIKNSDQEIRNLDLDLEIQEEKKQPTIKDQKTVIDHPSPPKQTGEDSFQVPPPPAAPEFSFLDWVKYYKAKDARSPLIYAQTCIRRDDGSLRAEYENWLAMRKASVFRPYQPEPIAAPPPEDRARVMANVKEILRSQGLIPL
jgi:hypothetical protein